VQPNGKSELRVVLPGDAKPPALSVGNHLAAQVALQDGRTLRLPLLVEAARPVVTVIGKADILPQDSTPKKQLNIRLASEEDLPVGDVLTFSLKSAQPFPRNGTIEVASPDGSLHTTLSLADSNPALILESPDTLLATLQPLKAFGPSAFGPIRMRAVGPDGAAGDWLPLVTLVRLPTLTGLRCLVTDSAAAAPAAPTPAAATSDAPAPAAPATAAPAKSCSLTGSGLYFVDSVATDESFANPTHVPEGFVGTSLAVPPPTGAVYYLRLRDDPTTVDTVTLPAGPL
jgi:hypothetical protein